MCWLGLHSCFPVFNFRTCKHRLNKEPFGENWKKFIICLHFWCGKGQGELTWFVQKWSERHKDIGHILLFLIMGWFVGVSLISAQVIFYRLFSTCFLISTRSKCERPMGRRYPHPDQCWKDSERMEWVGIAVAKLLRSCPTLRPHRRQPTRLPRPWDSPGKNTGVGCHFLLQCMQEKVRVKSLSRVWLLATPWTAAYQAPPSMGFSRQEYWSRWPLPSPWVGIRRTHARTSLTHSCLNLATGISASTMPPSQSALPTARPIFPKSFNQLTLRLSVLISAFWWSIWNSQIMAGLGSKSPNSGPLPHSSEMKAWLLACKTLLPLPPLPFSLSHSVCSSNTVPT